MRPTPFLEFPNKMMLCTLLFAITCSLSKGASAGGKANIILPTEAKEKLENMYVYDWSLELFEAYTEGIIRHHKEFTRLSNKRSLFSTLSYHKYESDFFDYGKGILQRDLSYGDGAKLKYLIPYIKDESLSVKNFTRWSENVGNINPIKCSDVVLDEQTISQTYEYFSKLNDACLKMTKASDNVGKLYLSGESLILWNRLERLWKASSTLEDAKKKGSRCIGSSSCW